ncbi:type VII secretion integral membrane protein EccD [Mycobacterium sp.]|uniref:type VII secretion integral membrane protein EccD n=1 Tax=Mycobacterium sp. TaxID=1785 RepID=UPI0025FDA259|nr:type VII secretion integral membrane protein EccD [Mycobacterium sp.]
MSASDVGLRRVSVHTGTAVVDVTLSGEIPVAVLIPSIVDILKVRGCAAVLEAERYHLSPLGAGALDPLSTLEQHGIEDGAVLMLSRDADPPPAPRYDDVAVAVSAALEEADPARTHPRHRRAVRVAAAAAAGCLAGIGGLTLVRNAFSNSVAGGIDAAAVLASGAAVALLLAAIACRTYRDPAAGLTLGVIATEFAAVAGFLAVPGTPGVPNVLLAASTATVTAVSAIYASGRGVTLTAISCAATVIAVAAVAEVFSAAPLRAVGAASTLISLGLLAMAARVSIVLAGLSPASDIDDAAAVAAKAIRADRWLTSLVAGLSSSAVVGSVVTVFANASRFSCMAFGALTSALLLLRARSEEGRRMLVFVGSGTIIAATTLGAAALQAPQQGPWVATSAVALAAAAMYLGFVAPAQSLSPLARRSADLLECMALIVLIPLTCWICGLYGAMRGLSLG